MTTASLRGLRLPSAVLFQIEVQQEVFWAGRQVRKELDRPFDLLVLPRIGNVGAIHGDIGDIAGGGVLEFAELLPDKALQLEAETDFEKVPLSRRLFGQYKLEDFDVDVRQELFRIVLVHIPAKL